MKLNSRVGFGPNECFLDQVLLHGKEDFPSTSLLKLFPTYRGKMSRYNKKRLEKITQFFLDIAYRHTANCGAIDYPEFENGKQIGYNRLHWYIDNGKARLNKSKKSYLIVLVHTNESTKTDKRNFCPTVFSTVEFTVRKENGSWVIK